MKILSSISVRTGGRTITFQRIEPPPVVEPAVAPLAAAVNPSPQRMASPPVLWRARQHKMLGLSCTVRELGVTSVRWWHEGQEYGVISSIDFHWLRGLGSFAVEDRELRRIWSFKRNCSSFGKCGTISFCTKIRNSRQACQQARSSKDRMVGLESMTNNLIT